MKSKELINILQENDPSGEIEVCVNNVDIDFIELLPSYYDGALQILKKDENGRVKGIKITKDGNTQKIKIHTLSLSDLIWDYDHLNIKPEYVCISEDKIKEYNKNIEKILEEKRKLYEEIDLGYFIQYVKDKVSQIIPENTLNIEHKARNFYIHNLSYKDEISDNRYESYYNRRIKSYDERLNIYWDGYDIVIEFKNFSSDNYVI